MKTSLNLYTYSLLLLLLCLSGSSFAQVGINTTTPEKELDINGELRIRTVPSGDLQTNSLLSIDDSGNVESAETFRDLVYAHLESPKASNRVVSATGGNTLVFGNGDWTNNLQTVLTLNEVTDTDNQYNPNTGIFTVEAGNEGFYFIEGVIRLNNQPGPNPLLGTNFNGNSGIYRGLLVHNNTLVLDVKQTSVLRGLSISGGVVSYDSFLKSFIYLEEGDTIQLRFLTFGTSNMNSDNDNIQINKSFSRLNIYKVF